MEKKRYTQRFSCPQNYIFTFCNSSACKRSSVSHSKTITGEIYW
ncbi:hypothetical protein [Ruminococcus albus]|nr:hypothetical protein [Ruminococcus albus]